MKTTSSLPSWRWTIALGIAIAAAVLVARIATEPSLAREEEALSPQPHTPYGPTLKLPGGATTWLFETAGKLEGPSQTPAGSALSGESGLDNQVQVAQQQAEEPKKSEKAKKKELDNQSCLDCHNPDILKMSAEELQENVVTEDKPAAPRAKPRYVFGELSLAIDERKYGDAVHADTTCVECHADIEDLPHKQRLKTVDCSSCHEESVEQVAASAHGKKAAEKGLTCIGCHDAHYGKGKDAYVKDFQGKICLDCHNAYGMDTLKAHANLYEYELHAKMGCLICHYADKRLVHMVPAVKTKVARCESCHTRYSVLSTPSTEKYKPADFFTYITQTGFTNVDALKKYGYVLGAHRIPLLDTVIILVVLGTLGLPVVHGGLRILTRRKGPIELPEEKILLHPLAERIWHWFQALCIVVLIITGIMLHWPELCPGWFDWAVTIHNWSGWGVVIAFLFWLFYNLASRRISHYIPKKGDIPAGMIEQAKFYAYGIFKHEPHPYAPTEDNKFNPLQKISYSMVQLVLLPILLISGLLYMYPTSFAGAINAIGGMKVLGIIHFILGALFAAFLLAHLYLATTGETVGENFKAIVFGYGIKAHDDTHHA